MRCTLSALTKMAVVGIVAVSTVSAQQSRLAGTERVDQIASLDQAKEGNSAPQSIGDPVYGVSSARGARYLLRNGLDYLNYGEYERALKYLRETENRKNELSNAEKLVLQKSIETAKRGLREASDAEAPYALSDQASIRHGFSPAKPETRTARQYDRPKLPGHRESIQNQANIPRAMTNKFDDQGEPIRLAKSDDATIAASSHNAAPPKSIETNSNGSAEADDSDRPRQLPEIPELPSYSQAITKAVTPSPTRSEFAQPLIGDRAQDVNLNPIAAGPSIQDSPAVKAPVPDDSTVLVNKETEDVSPLQTHEQSTSDFTAPASSSLRTPLEKEEADNLSPSQSGADLRTDIENQAMVTSTTGAASTDDVPVSTNELPPLPTSLSESATTLESAVKPMPKPTFPNATPAVTTDLSARGISHKEAETFPPLPAQDKGIAVVMPGAPEGLSSLTQSALAQSAVAHPRSSLGSAESIDLRSNSAPEGPNPESAQKVVARLNRNNDALDAPPPLPRINISDSSPSRIDSIVPSRPSPTSTLRPELKREVETIARKQEDELRRRQQAQPVVPARDTIISDLRAQTQLDISRAPSPAEARPIKAIPVPEDWVSLAPRNWSAQRKYWAAAATCHLPLYFQDPVLERYGHSIEQFLGPIGRHLTYPLDAPTQSTQRNQILQPFFSAGLFAFQIAALPYNAIVDPPWEAQYDLGYYRPGDVIPTDTYWIPLHGYGPPFQGSNY